jgi:crotonobetainyl-CoA:carnitine CoA-transferase CaiB-like acyl-CoA transferase
MIQGMSGIMDLTGEPDGPPQKIGVAFADIFTGLYGVVGIQSALLQRASTGKGQHIDLALLDCMGGVLANQAMNYLATGKSRRGALAMPIRTSRPTRQSGSSRTDTSSSPAAMTASLPGSLPRSISQRLALDPRFLTNPGPRGQPGFAHRADPSARHGQWAKDNLLAALEKIGVPAGPINSVAELFADAQFSRAACRSRWTGVPGIRTPLVFSDAATQSVPAVTASWRAQRRDPCRAGKKCRCGTNRRTVNLRCRASWRTPTLRTRHVRHDLRSAAPISFQD